MAPDEALALPALCAGDEPAVLLIWPDAASLTAIEQRMADCWPEVARQALTKPDGKVLFVRLSRGVEPASLAMPYWSFPQPEPNEAQVEVPEPIGVVYGNNRFFILSRANNEIQQISPRDSKSGASPSSSSIPWRWR